MRWHAMALCVLLSACSNAPVEPVQQAPSAVGTTPTPSMPSAGVSGSAVAGSIASPARAGTAATAPQIAAGSTAPTAGSVSAAAGSSNAGAQAGAAGSSISAAAGVGAAGTTASAGAVAGAGTNGAAGAAGVAGAANSGNSVPGCEGSTLLALPEDTLKRGPWPVGNKTVKFGRFSAVEIFYPAQPGSEQGKEAAKFDLRVFLPKNEQSKVPDDQATILSADTYRELPIDGAHGPYPVMILVHGTAAFRVASLSSQALWASRGFVVMVADHPGLYLADYIACGGQVAGRLDLSADVDSELAALTSAQGDLAFVMGHVDMKRVALAGHSAGAYNVAQFSSKPGVQVVIPLAGTRAVATSSSLKSVAFVAGMSDSVLPYGPGGSGFGSILYPGSDVDAYTGTRGAVKKRLLGITNGGHLSVTDLCKKNAKNQSDLEVAQANGVCGVASIVPLADCGTSEPVEGIAITNDFVTGVLEETLHCQNRSAWISGIKMRHPAVGELRETLP
jgi:hypothetical protein